MKKILLLLLLLLVPLACAHLPRMPESNIINVHNPEISQAFYSELTGEPHTYRINSTHPFRLYIQVLVPAIENIDKDVTFTFNGATYSNANWNEFFEPYAGDSYFEGPSYEIDSEAGVYLVNVSSPDKEGKYVFIVGKQEKFTFEEVFNTLILLPKMKMYFGKSPLTAYNNYVGIFMLMIAVSITLISLITIWLIKKYA